MPALDRSKTGSDTERHAAHLGAGDHSLKDYPT